MNKGFGISGLPELIFERGAFLKFAEKLANFGSRVLVISDAYMKEHPNLLKNTVDSLSQEGLSFEHVSVSSKQTQQAAHDIGDQIDLTQIDCIVSIGGTRAIDVAKLISSRHPHMAVPTTAGTGAAMNGVVFGGASAHQGTQDISFLPRIVVADPAFIDDMARDDFAARALGVLSLLMEAYISPKASVLSDALVWSGLEAFARGFVPGVEGKAQGREAVFYASLMAGVGAGQAGYGLTHRLAALIERSSDLSYAQASATICAETCDLQIQVLSERLPDHAAMDKYALVGELLGARPFEACEEAYASLVGTLRRWVARLDVPKLNLSDSQLNEICSEVTHDWDESVLPVGLNRDDILESLLRRQVS